MISLTEENYLKMMLHLSKNRGEVSVNELSHELGIKMPTVNSMMKKLAEKGFVIYESYKPIRLTDSGRTEAALVLRKHRLTETFLFEKMGFGWDQVHPIAEQIEHIQSIPFFDKMDEMLNYPTIDPHGEPIPSKNGEIILLNYSKLSTCKEGDIVTFAAVNDPSDEFLQFLDKRNLRLGLKIRIVEKETFDDSMTVSYDKNRKEILSKLVCDKILIV
ncbi:MAG: metal-dependent transcriptional regulator [Dysgonomonas sp.]